LNVLTITRFTRETAFNVIFHKYMRPPIFTTIIVMVIITTIDEKISRPIKRKVTPKIAAKETPRLNKVSDHVVKYCS
jgi:hypothetical protein